MGKKTITPSLIVSGLSGLVQYYDYHLFGFLAVAIANNFAPKSDHINSLLITYAIMSISVLAKPIGALFLGRLGDIEGRAATLRISLIGLAISSFIIGITPSYARIGIITIIIVIIFRMIICALASSGSDGVRLYIYEKMDPKLQCFGSGLGNFVSLLGSLVASFSSWFFTTTLFPEYGWRFAFIFGAFMGACVLYLNSKVDHDTTYHKENKDYDIYKDVSIIVVIKKHFVLFILCSLIAGGIGASYQFQFIFLSSYHFQILHNIDQSSMKLYTSVGIGLYLAFALIGGFLADKFGKMRVCNIAFLCLFIISFANIFISGLSVVLFLLTSTVLPFFTITSLVLIKQSIPISIRYRIFSLTHAVGTIVISNFTALLAIYIYKITQITWLPYIYFIVIITMMAITANILYNKSNI